MKKEEMHVWQIVGPIALCLSLALAARGAVSVDLCLAGCIGLFLSARFQMKGCLYALILLIAAGIFAHVFIESHHFWRLGLEAAIGCSFFITSLAFEGDALTSSALQSQLEAKGSAIGNLEEEIALARKQEAEQQIAFTKKIEDLQKNLEELQTEKATLEILNDVLRRNNASYSAKEKGLEEQSNEEKGKVAELLLECEELQNEIARIKQTDFLLENKGLLHQLNGARIEKEQTHLINETLVRLHAKESIRAKEAVDQLLEKIEEERRVQQQLAAAIEEVDRLSSQLDALGTDSRSPAEIEDLKRERDDFKQQLVQAEEKIQVLAAAEIRYRQLQSQFEEKNRILHETRKALFKADTELQTIRIEKEQRNLDADPLSVELRAELDRLDEESAILRKENEDLQDVVTHLTNAPTQSSLGDTIREAFSQKKKVFSPPGQPSLEETLREALAPKKKKKSKKVPQQDLLF